ncbi:MAG: hypothetical protein JO147_11105 [Actinobacteria bacterium]|nr:hypothetical protein [Actinomycetota bacterium]
MLTDRPRTALATSARLVRSRPSAASSRNLALGIGTSRCAVGVTFLGAPGFSLRMLGIDRATAGRMEWLARMTAGRDLALGVGTVVGAVTGRGVRGWLFAGAACDLLDAVVIAAGVAQGRLSPIPAGASVAGAAGAAAAAGYLVARAPLD